MDGLIDIHTHILPGVDDGCQSITESLRCARALYEAGFTHTFCTPHVWPNLTDNNVENIRVWTNNLQQELAWHEIPLTLIPGGELSLHAKLVDTMPAGELVTHALNRRFVLVDLWADRLPAHFESTVRWLQTMGLTVILAHPERMRAVQVDPALADRFEDLGVLLQGNLQCFADRDGADTRRVAELYLREERYFALASDTHGPDSVRARIEGLKRVRSLVCEETVRRLLHDNPSRLLP